MRIYLDNCCFNRPYDDQSQISISIDAQAKLFIQRMIKECKLELVTSFVLVYENSLNPYEVRKAPIGRFIKQYSSIHIGEDKMSILEPMIKEIMSTGIKVKDASHIASAILAECDYLITTDKRMMKYKSDKIVITSPIDFIKRLEDEV